MPGTGSSKIKLRTRDAPQSRGVHRVIETSLLYFIRFSDR